MSDIFKKIRSGAGKVAKEADKAVDIKRIELQIASIKKEIEEEFGKLGRIIYENDLTVEENDVTTSIIEKINKLKTEIAAKEEEVEDIKSQSEEPSPVASKGKRFCSECGAENSLESKFCSSCGAKME